MTSAAFEAMIALRSDGGANHINTERDLWTALMNEVFKIGEVKKIRANATFITTNFDETGLGIGSFAGWAIENGNNGTTNVGGRVDVAYDSTNYPILGAMGGSKNAVLIGHTHDFSTQLYDSRGTDGFHAAQSSTDSPAHNLTGTTSTAGGSEDGIGKNMQPYIVTLSIVRIA